MEPIIVGIRFQKVGKVYHFDASNLSELEAGDFVVVETSRGQQLGEVIGFIEDPPPPPEGTWKPILRKADPRDLLKRQINQKKELEALVNCRAKAIELGYQGLKIAAAELSFDGSKLAFLYSSESEGKLDLKRLRNAIQRLYPQFQIEWRLIGPRDVAKLLGGFGACGLENRCCSRFLTDFSPISIKMAKEQGISLTPTEITGMCGRLRCCLVYEYEQYLEAKKNLPKRGKHVVTHLGEGKVVDVYPLKMAVIVEFPSGVQQEIPLSQIQPWDDLDASRQKTIAACESNNDDDKDM
ncbi:MAG: PSP1 domain-containing protein [Anaerolineales bacterium]